MSGKKSNNMEHKPMTNETKFKLLRGVESGIEYFSKSVVKGRDFIEEVKFITNFMAQNKLSTEDKVFGNIQKLLEYRMLIALIYLDLASSMRAYLKSKYAYEERFSIRQVIVTINEGYKQIYNFVRVNENGDLVTKHRNKSYWYEDMRVIIIESLPELKADYDSLTKELDDYFTDNFEAIKEQRDLSVHYDRKASKVYDMIAGLEVEGTIKKLSPFLNILTKMFRFTEKIASISEVNERQEIAVMKNSLESMFLDIETKINGLISNSNPEVMDSLKKEWTKIKTDFLDK